MCRRPLAYGHATATRIFLGFAGPLTGANDRESPPGHPACAAAPRRRAISDEQQRTPTRAGSERARRRALVGAIRDARSRGAPSARSAIATSAERSANVRAGGAELRATRRATRRVGDGPSSTAARASELHGAAATARTIGPRPRSTSGAERGAVQLGSCVARAVDRDAVDASRSAMPAAGAEVAAPSASPVTVTPARLAARSAPRRQAEPVRGSGGAGGGAGCAAAGGGAGAGGGRGAGGAAGAGGGLGALRGGSSASGST